MEVHALKIPDKMEQFLFMELTECLDKSKCRRVRNFVREGDRLRGLFADLLIRDIIMRKTGLENKEISFCTNKYGKPYLKNRADIHFNISHSGMWAVAAVDSQPVGIDVERVGNIDYALSSHYFSESEHKNLMNQEDKLSYFFTLWTVKESFVKNLGKGMAQPLNSFSVKFITKERIYVKFNEESKAVQDVFFAQYDIHEDYKMVLCASHKDMPKEVTMESCEGIIQRFIA